MRILHLSGIRNVAGTLRNRRSIIGGIALTLVFWTVFMLLVFPAYAVQQLQFGGVGSLDNAIATLLWYQYASGGPVGVVLPAAISILAAVSIIYFITAIRTTTPVSESVWSGAAGGIGFLSAGCASCSVGALSLLGFTGGLALLPFNGRELQVASIGLLVLSLEYAGRNTTCRIDNGRIL